MKTIRTAALAGSISLVSMAASAHPQAGLAHVHADAGQALYQGMMAGMLHPWSGADHLLLALGLGLLVGFYGRLKASAATIWLGLLALLVSLCAGFAMALLGGFSLLGISEQAIETGILLSAVGVGISVLIRQLFGQKWLRVDLAVAILLAICHGAAHAFEMPRTAAVESFGVGMVISMAGLYLAGAGIMRLVARQGRYGLIPSVLAALGLAFLLI